MVETELAVLGAAALTELDGRGSLVITPRSVADKSHQLFLAELNVLQVWNIRRSGERGRTGLREGRNAGLRVQGAGWARMGPRSRLDIHENS